MRYFSGPKDIPNSVIEASAAASAAAVKLSDVRYSLTQQKRFPPERNVADEKLKIGVFICNCGSNIAEVVNVHDVAKYAQTLPGVTFVEKTLFACSQDSQDLIRRKDPGRRPQPDRGGLVHAQDTRIPF